MRHSETRAVITGGTQGLGLAIAKRLASEGAKSIVISGRNAYIEGVPELHGAPVYAPDLRGGAALAIAGLMAQGTTEIYNPETIARGYEHLEAKLNALGALIKREPLVIEVSGDAVRV